MLHDKSPIFEHLITPGTQHTHQVILAVPSLRLDRYLADSFPLYSRSFFKRLIEEGCVAINGKEIRKQGILLKNNDTLVLAFPQERTVESSAVIEQTDTIQVVHTADHFLIINKPAGITVHQPHSNYTNPTVVDWLLLKHNDIAHVGYIDRPGIVHRLDKDTSGLMIIARTNHAHTQLSQLFKDRSVKKTYLALVEGHPPREGTIDFAIGRHPHHRNKMAVFNCGIPQSFSSNEERTRDAVTHYAVQHYYETCSLIEVKPVTGRTHQIRVHFAALGHPLVGDLLYGNKSAHITRHALHAYTLSFTFDHSTYEFKSAMAPDFEKLLTEVQTIRAK